MTAAPNRRRFQFGLNELLIVPLFSGAGIGCLLLSEGSLWRFASMTMLGGALLGAALGSLFHRGRRFAGYGLLLGALFVIYAASS
jgi:hypothetical protein